MFLEAADRIRRQSAAITPMVSAAYTPEERDLLRQHRERVDEREHFKLKRDLEAYYVPVHRSHLTYDRVSLHWMANNMGTELAWRAR